MESIKVLIWEQRNTKGITLIQLAKLTGLGKSTINNMENHKTSPTLKELERIAIALHCRITDLFESEYK